MDGFNGGGSGCAKGIARSGTGGGATHIAWKDGTLASLSEFRDEVIIVAGGGGGGCDWYEYNATRNKRWCWRRNRRRGCLPRDAHRWKSDDGRWCKGGTWRRLLLRRRNSVENLE